MGNKQSGAAKPPEEPPKKLLDEPWRNLKQGCNWDEKYEKELLDEINGIRVKVNNLNIPLVGLIKAGKSSFINTVASIDKGRISQTALAGGVGESLTTKLKRYKPNERLSNFKLIDTMGLQGKVVLGMHVKEFIYLLDGNVPAGYQFNPANPISEETTPNFRKNPSPKNKMHCAVIMMDANLIGNDNIQEDAKSKVQEIMREIVLHDIPRLILLTKIDVLCEKVASDITNTYKSVIVKKAVDKAAQLFAVPEQNIFPIQNYTKEVETDHQKEILILLALRQIVRFSVDFLNVSNQDTDSDDYEEEA